MKINLFLSKFGKLEKYFLGFLFSFLTLAIFVQIIIRWTGLHSISWLEEFSQNMFVCSAFLGASIAVTEDGHMKIRVLETLLPKKVLNTINVIMNVVCGAASFFVAHYALTNTSMLKMVKTKTPVMGWPMYVIYGFVTLCLVCMGIRFILRAICPSENNDLREGT